MGWKNHKVVLTWCLSWVSNPYIRVRSNLLLGSSRCSGGGGVVVTRPRKMRRMRILHLLWKQNRKHASSLANMHKVNFLDTKIIISDLLWCVISQCPPPPLPQLRINYTIWEDTVQTNVITFRGLTQWWFVMSNIFQMSHQLFTGHLQHLVGTVCEVLECWYLPLY
jgi:hypothetical protein